MAYFDANASAPLHPLVAAMLREHDGRPLNPSSPHRFGREARKRVEDARRIILSAAGAPPGTACVFVSGGTEANNMALKCFGMERYVISAAEHASVSAAVPPERSALISVDRSGRLNLVHLEALLKENAVPGKTVVSVCAANNETGVLQDLSAVSEMCRRYAAFFHCDASQAFGKIPFSIAENGADFVTLSAHKIGGLPGAGALLFPERLQVEPLLAGGGQERRLRSGTENVPAVAAFGLAASAIDEIRAGFEACRPLIRLLEDALPEALVAGKDAPRLPNTSCLMTPGIRGDVRMAYFDAAGYAVSLGSACSSGRASDSKILESYGYTLAERESAVRVSLAPGASADEMERFIALWHGMDRRNAPTSFAS